MSDSIKKYNELVSEGKIVPKHRENNIKLTEEQKAKLTDY
jgi:hypothetical protein